jgi:hypothetical protein
LADDGLPDVGCADRGDGWGCDMTPFNQGRHDARRALKDGAEPHEIVAALDNHKSEYAAGVFAELQDWENYGEPRDYENHNAS